MPQQAVPGPSAFYGRNRGGGLYSEHVSQRAGALLAAAAHRLRLAPAALTLAGLAVGLGSSVAMISLAPASAAGRPPPALVAIIAGLGWQVAYALDCADGQLARVTGRSSPAGARLDILSDVAVQASVVTAVVAMARAHAPATPAWVGAAFASTWMVNLVTSVLARDSRAASLIRSRGPVGRMVKLVRDYGAVVAGCALVLAFAPARAGVLMAGLFAVNGSFLAASIAAAARASLATTIRPAALPPPDWPGARLAADRPTVPPG